VESGLMEPEVDGKPLLSLNDLEARLVFTRCKVSILSTTAMMHGIIKLSPPQSLVQGYNIIFSILITTTKIYRFFPAFYVEHVGSPLDIRW